MFRELLDTDGVREVCELRGRFGFMAFHGGNLERATDEIASAAAAAADASFYAVIQPPRLRWHIPSTLVTPEHSGLLAAFVEHCDVVVAVHGYGRDGFWTSLLLGGRNRVLAAHLAAHLGPRCPDHEVLTDLERIPRELRGQHATNPVNLTRGQGVQLELPPRIRGTTPHWRDWRGPGLVPPAAALAEGLAEAARAWTADEVLRPSA